MERAQAGSAAEDLWANLRSRLERSPDATDPHADVAATAGLFDLLSNSERVTLARYMFEELKEGLRHTNALSPLQHAVLGLVDPYITNSDLEPETRLLLSNALSKSGRGFQDDFSIAQGLIDLSYRVPGSDDLWVAFYTRYADKEEVCHDAFDVALAGLAPWNLRRFGDLISNQPAEPWLVDRLDMFLPTLTRNFTPAQVSEVVQSLYDRCPQAVERRRLALLAEAYELSLVEKRDTAPLEVVHGPAIPEALQFARTIVSGGLRSDPQATKLALDRRNIHVYRSEYAGENVLYQFQHEVVETIRQLAGTNKTVTSSESEDFSEFHSPLTVNRKVAFAFPTYLTAAKRSLGYFCARFGWQRRIGIIFPHGHRLHGREHPTTLEGTLHEVMRDQGTVYCMRNYAISEIVWQVASKDEQLEAYFDQTRVRICEHRNSVPLISHNKSRNFVFLFDLSQRAALERRTRARAPARPSKSRGKRRDTWIKRARLATLSHSESIEVGVVFSKYMVDWLSQGGRWNDIETFVATHAARADFARALSALGIDVEEKPPPAAVEHTPITTLRIVHG